MPTEATPLLLPSTTGSEKKLGHWREDVYAFLEAKTSAGSVYERFTFVLILLNVVSFIFGSLFVEEYNKSSTDDGSVDTSWTSREHGLCGRICDGLFFGNYEDNMLQGLNIGATSVLEIFTVAVFTLDYLWRIYLADLENPNRYSGFMGRLRYLPTFFSLVDLASTVPFYVDSFFLRDSNLAASQFLRMFRLFRMMRVEGRYDTALTMFDDVFYNQKDILGTALFVGVTTWLTVASLYYQAERRSNDMIYCGRAPSYCGDPDEIDVSLCQIDQWGIVDCSPAGCPPSEENPEPCYNLYRSIPMASYYTLLNLFGEFPLIDQHCVAGKIVATLTAIVAVAIFALPASIIGNGLEDIIYLRRKERLLATNALTIAVEPSAVESPVDDSVNIESRKLESVVTVGFEAPTTTRRGRWYNFLLAHASYGSTTFDMTINFLVVGTALTFMLDTVSTMPPGIRISMDIFEFIAVVIFTLEYAARWWVCKEDPKYAGKAGRLLWMTSFLPMIDLLTVVPYWIDVCMKGQIITPNGDKSSFSVLVKSLRLLRILRFERYTQAFTTFDDVISENGDILAVTGFSAIIVWIFLSAILYFTERDNPDDEMAQNYKSVPDSMWMTLLNLSGESPLAQYSIWGKIITGFLGLLATGLFGIPIGVLGAGFESVVARSAVDTPDEDEDEGENANPDSDIEQMCYNFVNGIGSRLAKWFEIFIYILIMLSVAVGIWQTVDGHESSFASVEWFSVIVFTIEYLIRLVGVPSDPQFDGKGNWFICRVRFIFSFYSLVDLLAILPFYLAVAFPGSWVDDYDEMFRMLRLLRLIKLDKYFPSITLIDDVIRLKWNALRIAGFAALSLWIIFAGLLYLTENKDTFNEIDDVPLYGCSSDCTMSDRFQNFFDSMIYTGVHLTGDYPITTYSWPAKFINFFMVISAVGVVSIPSGLIASGFMDIVARKSKARNGELQNVTGDDWYEERLMALENEDPPLSRWGPRVDEWQTNVHEFLNGRSDGTWTTPAYCSRIVMFTIIVLNVLAVLVESIPEIDRAVGNQKGNFFDRFEAFSVSMFALEYALRLFSAPKNKEALYSTAIYATTFFGIVDLLSTAPWFIQQALLTFGLMDANSDSAKWFRIFRIFRMLQLEDFIVAFSKLDNVFRASKDVLKATGLLALIIWIGCAALFFLFEENNPNWRSCDQSIPSTSDNPDVPGCYDFSSTKACNSFYPGLCTQRAFTNVPNAMFYTAVFLGGEWGVIDFTWPGRVVCLFLCVAGIALYAVPIGTLFDSFGVVLGMQNDEEDDEENSSELKA